MDSPRTCHSDSIMSISGKQIGVSRSVERRNQILIGGMYVAVPTFLMLAGCIHLAEEDAEQRAALHRRSLIEVVMAVIGSLLYTTVGAANLLWLRQDDRLTPLMVFSNSFMCWSAFFFGFIQIYTNSVAGLRWSLRFDNWYTLPNFGWGIEWGFHLLGGANSEVCGLRVAIIMSISIASIGLKYLVVPAKVGYVIALVPQVLGAFSMCIYCIRQYYSQQAMRALCFFLLASMAFLVLHVIDGLLPAALTGAAGYETGKLFIITLCDNSQIHFSIRFFVEMFRTKRYQQVDRNSQEVSSASELSVFPPVGA